MAGKVNVRIELYEADGNLRTLGEIEADVINLAMSLHGGCVAEVARQLRIGRSTLYRKLERNEDLSRRAMEAANHPLSH